VNVKLLRMIMVGLIVILASTACIPQATATPVDVIGTTAAQLAMVMLTQTAGAVTATPVPPTTTQTLPPTETPAPTPTDDGKRQPTVVITFVPCFTGPDESYTFISNIDPSIRRSGKQVVEILGIGNVPGWVVIRNPYFNNPCWVREEHMEIGPHIILPDYPVMTPGPKP
jgi:hypothetical protein